MDDEDFLAAVEADNANAPAEEPKPEPETPAEPEVPTPEPEAPAPAEPAPPEPIVTEVAKPEPVMVPIGVLHEVRDELKTVKADLSRFQQQQQPEPVQIPDPIEDPEGYAHYQNAQFQNRLLNVTLNTSERFARKEHGAETVEAAKAWATQRFATDPLYQAQVLNDADPYERVVTDYRREQLFSKVSDPSEFDAFLAWKAAQGQLQQQGGQPPPPTPAPSIPPRSLASAPSAGSIREGVVQGDEEIFAEVMPKR